MAKAVYRVEFYLAGGQVVSVEAHDLQVGVVPEQDDDGTPNPRAGELTGFNLEAIPDEKLSYLYARVPQIDMIRATEILPATGRDKKDAERKKQSGTSN